MTSDTTKTVGWVERSETQQNMRGVLGYAMAPPNLRNSENRILERSIRIEKLGFDQINYRPNASPLHLILVSESVF
ncbi:MAG: hypothetical protein F6K14_07600 [Symploca sp. SIO2C1]|nr:hypothetical protein [Symploca sp. SIO2C1]